MFADHIFAIAAALSRSNHNELIDDRLLADIGLTRAEFIKQSRRSSRKASQR
jgi:uncharacterized protein YjiS (DUF1127 family)